MEGTCIQPKGKPGLLSLSLSLSSTTGCLAFGSHCCRLSWKRQACLAWVYTASAIRTVATSALARTGPLLTGHRVCAHRHHAIPPRQLPLDHSGLVTSARFPNAHTEPDQRRGCAYSSTKSKLGQAAAYVPVSLEPCAVWAVPSLSQPGFQYFGQYCIHRPRILFTGLTSSLSVNVTRHHQCHRQCPMCVLCVLCALCVSVVDLALPVRRLCAPEQAKAHWQWIHERSRARAGEGNLAHIKVGYRWDGPTMNNEPRTQSSTYTVLALPYRPTCLGNTLPS